MNHVSPPASSWRLAASALRAEPYLAEAVVDALRTRRYAARVAEDVRTADASGVAGTPTFFINGQRHYGRYDIDSLKAAVAAAHEQASVAKGRRRKG